MMTRASSAVLLALMLSVAAGRLVAAEPVSSAVTERFFNDVQPVLQKRCVTCHGADKQAGGLRLDSRAAILKGGGRGAAVVPGRPETSLLVQSIRHTHEEVRMPPKEKLSDAHIALLTRWVQEGAVYVEKPLVLFEDEPEFLKCLTQGNSKPRLITEDRFRGAAALAVAPRDSFADRIPGWNFALREHPQPGQYRYLRYSWKKVGGGGAMFEVARNGAWPDLQKGAGRYVAGRNSTGWPAQSLGPDAPSDWTTVTLDLWKDLGDATLTGVSLMALDGTETRFDSILLAATRESLDAYLPGKGLSLTPASVATGSKPAGSGPSTTVAGAGPVSKRIGNAWSDLENPIVKIFEGQRLDLWSLKPPRKGEPPAVKNTNWPQSPLDRFVLAKLEAKGLSPSRPADRRTLLRRLHFDLAGLPPSLEETQAFLDDTSPDAYEKLVDRLLASPRYGERWGRLWLDVVRYADTHGFERDEFRPEMWRYRDYVVRAFQHDKPFDQFVREQLAGDELVGTQPLDAAAVDKLLATGYLRLGPWDSTGSIFQEDKKGRNELMGDLANTTASAFLGLTFSCCQCHDHKYDPFSQADHYRLRAFFAAAKPVDKMPVETAVSLQQITQHNAQIDQQVTELQKQIAALLAPIRQTISDERRAKFPPEIVELLNRDEKHRDEATQKQLKPYLDQLAVNEAEAVARLDAAGKTAYAALTQQIAAANSRRRTPAVAAGMTDSGTSAPATHVFYQGDFLEPRDEVAAGFPSLLDPQPATIVPPAGAKSTGRRLTLANWIVARDNPWTARTYVNRSWQQFFGKGLVATPNDLGYSGARPTHPELLDWLAVEFMEAGWSTKKLHKQIVMSAVYQQASVVDASRAKVDPDNQLLWRQNLRRLDAESLRDSLLAVSGLLLPYDSGKPRWPPVPQDILDAQPGILEAKGGGDGGRMQGWYTDPVETTFVRTLFLVQKRSLAIPFLQTFDLPETTVSCGRRSVTIVAPQALTLLNNETSLHAARALAERLTKLAGDDARRRVQLAFQATLARLPAESEQTLCLQLLEQHTQLHGKAALAKNGMKQDHSPERLALIDLCRVVLNLNEFLYID